VYHEGRVGLFGVGGTEVVAFSELNEPLGVLIAGGVVRDPRGVRDVAFCGLCTSDSGT